MASKTQRQFFAGSDPSGVGVLAAAGGASPGQARERARVRTEGVCHLREELHLLRAARPGRSGEAAQSERRGGQKTRKRRETQR